MALIAHTVTIVNKSGKVVKTSKQLSNVWDVYKTAWQEKRAEINATRKEEAERKDDERRARRRLEALTLDDNDDARSHRSSRRGSEDGRSSTHSHRSKSSRKERPPVERGVSDSFYTNDHHSTPRTSERRSSHRPSPLRQESSPIVDPADAQIQSLTRRHTDLGLAAPRTRPTKPSRRASADDIDMDLAYGDLPPPLPERNYDTEVALRNKMSSLQTMLDSLNCLQHSVTATIDNLQKNPDAMAAVALTLAEISNLATKLAPGALGAMKGAYPGILALLASPQFAIAAGVGVGVTIIAFGGYKIVKKIKARKEAEAEGMLLEASPGLPQQRVIEEKEHEPEEEEMESLQEISRIELWRRGIADVEAESLGTSVDGEFVTPAAGRTLIEEGRLTEADFKPSESGSKKRRKHRSARSERSVKSERSAGGKTSSGTKVKAKKEPSGIRMLFKGRSD